MYSVLGNPIIAKLESEINKTDYLNSLSCAILEYVNDIHETLIKSDYERKNPESEIRHSDRHYQLEGKDTSKKIIILASLINMYRSFDENSSKKKLDYDSISIVDRLMNMCDYKLTSEEGLKGMTTPELTDILVMYSEIIKHDEDPHIKNKYRLFFNEFENRRSMQKNHYDSDNMENEQDIRR
jgi:hypothetical protein